MEEIQKIRISVRGLVEFILRSGDIDNRHGGGPMEREAMQEGSRIHRKIQGRMDSNYKAEVPLAIELPGEGYVLRIEGRADGILQENSEEWKRNSQLYEYSCESADVHARNRDSEDVCCASDDAAYVVIDEIKGMYRDVMKLEQPYPLHLAQAKCYAYIYGSQNGLSEISVQITYCNLETEEIQRFRELYTVKDLEVWFLELAAQYQKWAKHQVEWSQIRQASIKNVEFPFPWRKGQKEVAASVYKTILRRKKLFLQAPTGTGKTLSTIFPAVKAVGEGLADRIFYATAKTITRTVAEEGYELLRGQGLRMKTLTLTAKEKICFLDETACNPEACPYAKGHYDRVNDAVYELITTCERLDRPTIEAQAEKWQVCPFEFGLDVSLWADAIICDYNYIFDPRAKLKRFFGEGVKGEYLFLIDEAHNLVERGREMFSASLVKEEFLALKKVIKPYSPKMSRALNRCNSWLLEQKRGGDAETEANHQAQCGGSVFQNQKLRVLPNIGTFPVYLMNLCGVMEEFLEDSHHSEINEKVLELYFQVRHFLDTCDQLDENYVIYTEQLENTEFRIRLFCVDISKNLQECLKKGKSTIYFSATFLPINYYKNLLSTEPDDYAVYAKSTFDPRKRLVMIGTDTSSRYTNRNVSEFRKMASYILQLIRAKRGNYMVFFSSYRMMEDVAEQFRQLCEEEHEKIELICQETNMSEAQREEFLANFECRTNCEAACIHEKVTIADSEHLLDSSINAGTENPLQIPQQKRENALAGFCVMGGIFGEGIDLKADRLIGAVVVGTGLPQVCTERELLKNFYDKRGQDGFFYAYLCPGMNKVLQSAGRVIRTEEDEGVILLLDERFANGRYQQMFPEEWEQIWLCSLQNMRRKAEEFWEKSAAEKNTLL